MLEDPSQLNRPGDATPDLARARGPVAVKLAYLVRSSIKSEHHLFHSPRQPGCEGTRTVTAPLVLQRVLGGSPLETRVQRVRVGTPSGGLSGSIPGQQRRARTAIGRTGARAPAGTPNGTGSSRVGECRSEPHHGGAGLPSQGPAGESAATPGVTCSMVSQRLLDKIRATAETSGGADSSRLLEDTIREAIQASDEEWK